MAESGRYYIFPNHFVALMVSLFYNLHFDLHFDGLIVLINKLNTIADNRSRSGSYIKIKREYIFDYAAWYVGNYTARGLQRGSTAKISLVNRLPFFIPHYTPHYLPYDTAHTSYAEYNKL